MTNDLEAKICLLGAQGVGKTSLLNRFTRGVFDPANTASTIGASFLTKKVIDIDSGTTVRLQLWDTAGQERFHSISKLYYRGASAVLLVYSIVDEQSFEEMGRWLQEMKEATGNDIIIHVVGTKSDVVAQDLTMRRVPFERCIAYVAEQLYPDQISTPPLAVGTSGLVPSLKSNRSSGFWGQDIGWDCCHEISAKDGEGVEEVFRIITRKLVEQRHAKEKRVEIRIPSGTASGGNGHLERGSNANGSFRLGHRKRNSFMGFPTPSIGASSEEEGEAGAGEHSERKKGKCC